MSEFKYDILKQNVRALIKNNGMTQEQLGEILGMSQPNICKALSDNDKKCFTVSQIYDIADYFQVSIDWLVGYKLEPVNISQRSIGELIAKLLFLRIAKCHNYTIKEHVYLPNSNNRENKGFDTETEYKAIYFPNYWQPEEITDDFIESLEFETKAEEHGNQTQNRSLNYFLKNHQQILELYQRNQIQDEHYQIILKDYLGKLSTDSLKDPTTE